MSIYCYVRNLLIFIKFRSIQHYKSVEEQYNQWLMLSSYKNIYEYPEIVLKPQKDDVVQIADHW